VADHGEVFTSEREVNAMLDLVKQEAERIDSRFLEPACGDGNFLSEIFSEWSAVNGYMLKRRNFRLDQMLGEHAPDFQFDLFGDTGKYKDDASGRAVLSPVREFPPTHYKKVIEYE
jgi:hypothetical protein